MSIDSLKSLAAPLVLLLLLGCAGNPKATPAVEVEAVEAQSVAAARAYEQGNREKGLELYRALLKDTPNDPDYLNNYGVLLLETGQAREALDSFESASLLRPNDAEFFINVGFAHVQLGDYDEAMDFFDRAIQIQPGNDLATYGKGVAYLYLGEPEAALGLFRKANEMSPEDAQYLFMKAYAAQQNSLWIEAINGFTSYISFAADGKQKANAFSNRALCYFQLKDYKKGLADLGQAIRLNDDSPIYYYNRAQGYQMLQDYENAITDYTQAISRKVGFPEAYINRGELNYLLGKEAKGCKDLKRACDLGVCAPLKKYESAGKCSE